MKNPKRSTANRNHSLYYEPFFTPEPGVSLPVLTEKGPLVRKYLDIAYRVFKQARESHSRILVACFTLTIPHDIELPDDIENNKAIVRFIRSVESKVSADIERKKSPHRCPVRYLIAREISNDGMPHFHVVILLNGHAYRTVGTFDYEKSNLFWIVTEAWASALKVSEVEAVGCVRIGGKHQKTPGVSYYYLTSRDHYQKFPEAFKRASYLCKLATKQFGKRYKGVLSSQK